MITAYDAAQWSDIASTTVEVAATLAGLVFVSVSLNLSGILRSQTLPIRAWQTLVLLLTPLLSGILVLVPGQSNTALAWELIGLGVILGGGRLAIHRRVHRSEKDIPLPLMSKLGGLVSAAAPPLLCYICMAVAGATLLARSGGGLYWLVPSVLVAFIVGLASAWTLLVDAGVVQLPTNQTPGGEDGG